MDSLGIKLTRDQVFYLFLGIAILAGLSFFALSYNILQSYKTDKAIHENWCPRTVYGVYDPKNVSNGLENKTASVFKEFTNKTSVKEFCDAVLQPS